MERKNMVLLTIIAVSTLLVAMVGATFAYFTATITDNRGDEDNPGQANITAAQTPGSLTIEKSDEGFGSFNDSNVYPGHKGLIQLKITSDATNDTYFNVLYEGESNFPDDMIEFDIYQSTDDIVGTSATEAFKCEKKSETLSDGKYKLFEDCKLDTKLSTSEENTKKLQTIQLKDADSKVVLNGNHPFMISGGSHTMYYYVVVRYKDTLADQTAADQGKSLTGKITVEIAARDDSAISYSADDKLTKKNS